MWFEDIKLVNFRETQEEKTKPSVFDIEKKEEKLRKVKKQEIKDELENIKKLLETFPEDKDLRKKYDELKQEYEKIESKKDYQDILKELKTRIEEFKEELVLKIKTIKLNYAVRQYVEYMQNFMWNKKINGLSDEKIKNIRENLQTVIEKINKLNQVPDLTQIEDIVNQIFYPIWKNEEFIYVKTEFEKAFRRFVESNSFTDKDKLAFLKALREKDGNDKILFSNYDNSENIKYEISFLLEHNEFKDKSIVNNLKQIEINIKYYDIFKNKEFRDWLYKRWKLDKETEKKLEVRIKEFKELVEENWKENKDTIVNKMYKQLEKTKIWKDTKLEEKEFKKMYEKFVYARLPKIIRNTIFEQLVEQTDKKTETIDLYADMIWKGKFDISDENRNIVNNLTKEFVVQIPIVLASAVVSEWISVWIWWEEIFSNYRIIKSAKLFKKWDIRGSLKLWYEQWKLRAKNTLITWWAFYWMYEWIQTGITGENQYTMENLWKDIFVIWWLKILQNVKVFLWSSTGLNIEKLGIEKLSKNQNKILQTSVDYLTEMLTLWMVETGVKMTFDDKVEWSLEEVIHLVTMTIWLKYAWDSIRIWKEDWKISLKIWEWELRLKKEVKIDWKEINIEERRGTNKWKESWEETFKRWEHKTEVNLRKLLYEWWKIRKSFAKLLKEWIDLKNNEEITNKIERVVNKEIENIKRKIREEQWLIDNIWLYTKYEIEIKEWEIKKEYYKQVLYKGIINRILNKKLSQNIRKFSEVRKYIENLSNNLNKELINNIMIKDLDNKKIKKRILNNGKIKPTL